MYYIPDPTELMDNYQEKFIEGDKVRCAQCDKLVFPAQIILIDNWGTPFCVDCCEVTSGS